MHYHLGETTEKKKKCSHFEQRTSSQKRSLSLTVVGWNDSRAVYIASSKSSESKRSIWSLSKVERKYIQQQQPN